MSTKTEQIENSKSTMPDGFCSACGAASRRDNAKFCLVCGKLLREGYQPLDRLRASYRMQGRALVSDAAPVEEIKDLFEQNKNSVSQTASACLVYSLVPYLGILFIPFTLLIGSLGYLKAVRYPHLGGKATSLRSIGVSFIVLAEQLFLWWLLYIIPEIGKQI